MKIKHPSAIMVFAPSSGKEKKILFLKNINSIISGGKTEAVLRIIEERRKFIDKPIDEILYYYTFYNESFSRIKGVKFIQGIISEVPADQKTRIIVCDDQMSSNEAIERLISIYCRESHHRYA